MAYGTLLSAALLSSVANFATAQTCIQPTTAVAGYVLPTCENYVTGTIECSALPTCETGYSGTPTLQDVTCGSANAELTLGGCTGLTCIQPTTAVAGYVLPTCSNFQTGSIACSALPTCGVGYSGTPTLQDVTCGSANAELTLGGCTADAVTCTRPSAVTDTEYTITETDVTVAAFAVTLACAYGYSSTATPTAVACTSAGDYTVTAPCTMGCPSGFFLTEDLPGKPEKCMDCKYSTKAGAGDVDYENCVNYTDYGTPFYTGEDKAQPAEDQWSYGFISMAASVATAIFIMILFGLIAKVLLPACNKPKPKEKDEE